MHDSESISKPRPDRLDAISRLIAAARGAKHAAERVLYLDEARRELDELRRNVSATEERLRSLESESVSGSRRRTR